MFPHPIRREDEDSGGKLVTSGSKDHRRCRGMSKVLSKSWHKSAVREELRRLQCHNTGAHGLAFVFHLPHV